MTNNQIPVTEIKGAGAKDINYIKVLSIALECADSFYGVNPPTYHAVYGITRFDLLKNLKYYFDLGSEEALSHLREIEKKTPDIWGNWICNIHSYEVEMLDGVIVEGKDYVDVKVK